MTYLSS